MLLRPGGNPVLTAGTVAEMTRDQLTPAQRAKVWPGFSFLGDRGWGYGVSVTDGRYSWDGGFGTAWSNVPDRDLTVVVLTQRALDETGLPASATTCWPPPGPSVDAALIRRTTRARLRPSHRPRSE